MDVVGQALYDFLLWLPLRRGVAWRIRAMRAVLLM